MMNFKETLHIKDETGVEKSKLDLVLLGRDKFVPVQLNIFQDFFKNTFAKVFAFVKGYYSRAAIRMAKIDRLLF